MKFFKKLFTKKLVTKKGEFFAASKYEMRNLLCGIGESEIFETEIKIINYPFEPSFVYPERTIKAKEIKAISVDSFPPLLQIANEVVFVSREKYEHLKQFQLKNKIETFIPSRNWDNILEPYVDTEFSDESKKRTTLELEKKRNIQ